MRKGAGRKKPAPRATDTPAAPSLRELQTWMRWVLTDPYGVRKALEHRRGEPRRRCLDSIVEAPPLDRLERLDIYAEGYYSRLLECLEDDYETLKRVLGDKLFRRLVADYLEAHPSRSYTAAELGRHMPEFIAGWELAEALPYLPDLARLEWLCVESFFAENLPVYDLAKLQTIPESRWPKARFRLDPSVRLLRTDWNLDEMWGSEHEPAHEEARWLLVRRSPVSLRVVVDRLEPLQYRVLELLGQGLSLGALCEELSQSLDGDEQAEEASAPELPPLMDWFGGWLKSGVIRDVAFK